MTSAILNKGLIYEHEHMSFLDHCDMIPVALNYIVNIATRFEPAIAPSVSGVPTTWCYLARFLICLALL
jgi:hypothetical protein